MTISFKCWRALSIILKGKCYRTLNMQQHELKHLIKKTTKKAEMVNCKYSKHWINNECLSNFKISSLFSKIVNNLQLKHG